MARPGWGTFGFTGQIQPRDFKKGVRKGKARLHSKQRQLETANRVPNLNRAGERAKGLRETEVTWLGGVQAAEGL